MNYNNKQGKAGSYLYFFNYKNVYSIILHDFLFSEGDLFLFAGNVSFSMSSSSEDSNARFLRLLLDDFLMGDKRESSSFKSTFSALGLNERGKMINSVVV